MNRAPMRLVLAACVLAGAAPVQAAEVLRIEASEPRAYGYQAGDRVQRHVSVWAPDGWVLDEASLPRPGGRGQAIELRQVATRMRAEDGGRRIDLDLEYQVFLAPARVRTIEIPSFRLRYAVAGRQEEPLVEAWPVTVAPLAPADPSPRRGLGEMQPDRAPPLLDGTAARQRLQAAGAAAAALLAWLAWIHLGPPWRAARNRPFGVAWRQLRRLPAEPDAAQWRDACRQLHEALNRSAGTVLFEAGLPRFLQAHPAFASVGDDLALFLQASRREFFGDGTMAAIDGAWLQRLCRRCHDAERGL